jgi:hypothetical protein
MSYTTTPNTLNYDGTTNEKSFKWIPGFDGSDAAGADLALLRDQTAPTYDLFTKILGEVNNFVDSLDRATGLVNKVKARGLDVYAGGPPYPLEGALAAIKAPDLAAALLVYVKVLTFMQTPVDISGGVGAPVMVTPDTILRKLV